MKEGSKACPDSALNPHWSTPDYLLKRLHQRWQRGEFLANALHEQSLFPLRVPLRTPTAAEIRDRFADVQRWISEWKAMECQGLTCGWKTIRHRLFGENKLPSFLLFPDIETLSKVLNVHADWLSFLQLIHHTQSRYPELLPWLSRRSIHALSLSEDWPKFLSIIDWVRQNPRSGRFLRQVDLPGIHTKFVETHRSTLIEILDLTLPPDAIDPDARGVSHFNRRYGFQDKPDRIRIRFLDPSIAIEPNRLGCDLTITATAFANLCPPVQRVFITENEINFLAFPEQPDSLLIFGSGYHCTSLKDAQWLHQCEIHYWGDIDTHGFAILNQLRSLLPHVHSFLMDHETLNSLKDLATLEPQPVRSQLPHLTPEELALYCSLQNTSIRLEQEKIPYGMLQGSLSKIMGGML